MTVYLLFCEGWRDATWTSAEAAILEKGGGIKHVAGQGPAPDKRCFGVFSSKQAAKAYAASFELPMNLFKIETHEIDANAEYVKGLIYEVAITLESGAIEVFGPRTAERNPAVCEWKETGFPGIMQAGSPVSTEDAIAFAKEKRKRWLKARKR